MGFHYITAQRSQTLTNEPYVILRSDIDMMLKENAVDEKECRRVTESSYNGESYYAGDGRPGSGKVADSFLAFAKEVLYRDAKTSGFVMSYPHGVIVRQAERNHYYRGEKEIYNQSCASIFRKLSTLETEEERAVYTLIADMRIAEFSFFLKRFELVQRWEAECGTVLYEPLAQHYGLETSWLDITNDFKVALFFACCRWDNEQGKWFPLTKAETEQNEKTQYGVLFHIPQDRVMMEQALYEYNTIADKSGSDPLHAILPIGFQPFRRCDMQTGYGIQMQSPYPLQDDISFEKLHFRHDEKLSQWIYEEMDGGRKVYPQEGLNDFSDVIDQIKTATVFSEDALKYALSKSTFFSDETAARELLSKVQVLGVPVEISDSSPKYGTTRQRVRRLNQKTAGIDFEKDLGIHLLSRAVYTP